ncbi:hypothetical protein C9374_014263 [Naegleria lovaniensis]|uniref:Uncharacterized protein n=1 Tax=Naegleria lovaniensis TaxID=51637 RepID=A0AA88GAQ2_NAELO|nr:uncharacterized protein C9374_014263 [Naegleria lovaniensis]KAG2370740.1 hypothetical protein C9374_014263 [Naegleria lovaniensis]
MSEHPIPVAGSSMEQQKKKRKTELDKVRDTIEQSDVVNTGECKGTRSEKTVKEYKKKQELFETYCTKHSLCTTDVKSMIAFINVLATESNIVGQKLWKYHSALSYCYQQATRRTSTTILASCDGVTQADIKRHGNWTSNSVADRYQSENRETATKTALKISERLNSVTSTTSSTIDNTAQTPFQSCVFNNCTINFNF